jgi:hypothetical protein
MPTVSVNGKPRYPALMTTNTPLRLERVHQCTFNPAVYLNRNTLYYIIVAVRHPYVPKPGFYDVPEKGFITWITEFKTVAVSQPTPVKIWSEEEKKLVDYVNKAYIFEAKEGQAPKDGLII